MIENARGLSHDGLRQIGVGNAAYVEAATQLVGLATVPRPRVFPVALKWKADDGKYTKTPLCGASPGWRSADNAWQPGVPIAPRATHFGAVPADFGLCVLDEDNDRLDDVLRIVEAADVGYAIAATAAGSHVLIRYDYERWGELRNANWTALGAAGQIRGGNGWATLWAPDAWIEALDGVELSDNAPALIEALKRPKLPAGQRHDDANRRVYLDPSKRDETVLWLLASGYSRADAVKCADEAAADGKRDGQSAVARGGAPALDADSPVSLSKHMPITAKYSEDVKRWWLWTPHGYEETTAGVIEREFYDFAYDLWKSGRIDAKKRAKLDSGRFGADVVRRLEQRSDVRCKIEDWDTDTALLRMDDGRILNIATGEARDATPADMISRSLGASLPDPDVADAELRDAAASLFDFAKRGLCGDDDVVTWTLLAFMRYVLQGNRALRTNAYLHSTEGQTGKSTFGAAACALLGEYAATINVADLGERAHETWKLGLIGARLGYVDDMEQGALSSDFRRAVSGEVLKARALYSNRAITFPSQAAFLFTANVRLRTAHRGTTSRLQIVPWSETRVADIDEELRDKLTRPDVLHAWLGLVMRYGGTVRALPQALREAQGAYETESDTFGERLRDAGFDFGDGEIEDAELLAELRSAQRVPRDIKDERAWLRGLARNHPLTAVITKRESPYAPRRYYVRGVVSVLNPADTQTGISFD